MSERSRKWRRAVASAAFLGGLLFLSARTCKSENASAEIRLRVGDAGGELVRLEAELYRPGNEEMLGFYRRNYQRGSGAEAGRWSVHADSGMYRALIELETRRGTTRVERRLEIRDGAIITIDLEEELAGR